MLTLLSLKGPALYWHQHRRLMQWQAGHDVAVFRRTFRRWRCACRKPFKCSSASASVGGSIVAAAGSEMVAWSRHERALDAAGPP